MSVFRAKIWTGIGAAMVLGAGLAACGGEGEAGAPGGEAGSAVSGATAGEGEAAAPSSVTPPGGEGEGGEAGAAGETGATGEEGARAAYGVVPAESRRAMRLAQLKGFFLAAKAIGAAEGADAASALAGQGLLEVYDPARAELAEARLDETALRRAAQTGDPAALDAAVRALDAAERAAGGDPAAVARGLTAVTVGLYREAVGGGTLDPVEYQHAYAAALAAQSVAARAGALAPAKGDIDRLVRLWPSAVPPDTAAQAATLAQVQAQASRVELALSGA